jgi:ribosomal protein L15
VRAEEFSKNIVDLDDKIKFAGVMEKSGHLNAGYAKEGFEEYLKGKDQEISFSQTAHIVEMRKIFSSDLGNLKYIVYTYDKVKIFSLPLMDHIVVLSTEGSANAENVIEKNGSKIIVIS